jgi:uncharacterized membrane protein
MNEELAERRGVYLRGEEEFARVLTFSDGVYAIAMTLLVVGIGLPALANQADESELLGKLGDAGPEIFSFFLSFAVIGRYWLAHHEFFGLLRAVDIPFIRIHLLYLALVAFLPFPTDLLGNYFENAIATALYALTVAAVSGLEVALFSYAHRADLLRRPLTHGVYRWGVQESLAPVAFFLLSIPIAFVNTTLAVVVWFMFIPLHAFVLGPRKPPEADELLSVRGLTQR